jgi:response regulator NasT
MMSVERLRIAVADDEAELRNYYERILPALGHEVVFSASTGRELVDGCEQTQPDLVISDIRMPDLDGLEAIRQIGERRSCAVVVVSAHHDPQTVDEALRTQVMAFLVKPIKRADLETSILLAVRRFREMELMQRQAQDLRQALADRKVVERAKGVLMRQAQIDEATAFRRLQKLASDRNQRLIDAAQSILAVEEALRPDEC